MSADNTIAVLKTAGPEFRVIHAQAIENIFESPDYPQSDPVFNLDMLIEYFGKCQVFINEKKARSYAHKLYKEYRFVEYGIQYYYNDNIRFPVNDIPPGKSFEDIVEGNHMTSEEVQQDNSLSIKVTKYELGEDHLVLVYFNVTAKRPFDNKDYRAGTIQLIITKNELDKYPIGSEFTLESKKEEKSDD